MQNALSRDAERLLGEGLAHQRAGRAGEAAGAYARLVAHEPGCAEALHAAGLDAYRDGRFDDAILAIGAVVAIHPERAALHHDLAVVCVAAQKLAWAEQCLGRTVALAPGRVASWYNLAAVRLRLGKVAAAAAALASAQRLGTGAVDVAALWGVVLLRLGRRAEAEAAWEGARGAVQDGARGAVQDGAQLDAAGPIEAFGPIEASGPIDASEQIEASGPIDASEQIEASGSIEASGHTAMGMLAAELGHWAAAEAHYRAALRLDPADPVVWGNLGKLLRDAGRFDEGVAAADEAIRLRPDHADGHLVRGHALTAAGRLEAADASYGEALALDPAHADARYHRGLMHLLAGRYEEGWEGAAWCWRRAGMLAPHAFAQPVWDGRPMGEAGLLLHAEQGCGDTIQMARFVAPVAAASRVVLLVQPGLERLMARLPGVAGAVSRGADLPAFAAQFPLMNLPGRLGIRVQSIPADVPYLSADPADAAVWRGRLGALPGLRVGLAWAGSPAYRSDARRSIAPGRLRALAEVPGVSFVSLQRDGSPPFPMQDWMGEARDFADTAALTAGLDLVIAVDTAVAHLAGALGRPVWLLNRFDPCWRWLLGREDSPWYPTLRQFRQPAPGDWDSVVAAVRDALAVEAAKVGVAARGMAGVAAGVAA